jgi:hypothetical protein
MRGGTSKAVFFHENDLPFDREKRDKVILRVFGSPDLRQIDGLGGANSSTSKVAIIGPSLRPDADLDYTFGQVSVDMPVVGMAMNCGNISSAVGPFAIDEGLVKAVEPVTTVRIFNTNTRKRIIAQVPVSNGKALTVGDYSINGVPGTGARIDLEFEDPGGAVTGKTLPTGRPLDFLVIDGKPYAVSIIDAANPVVFVRAEDFGLRGTELPSEFESRPDAKEISAILEKIRGEAAVLVGLVPEATLAKEKSPELPKIGFYTVPTAYTDATGQKIEAEDIDITGRLFSMGKMINAYMGTGAICTIVAANIPGTVVSEIVKDRLGGKVSLLRIGHPFGVMPVRGILEETADGISVKRGIISRTARRIMEGWVYI